jgi:hypothetical protein
LADGHRRCSVASLGYSRWHPGTTALASCGAQPQPGCGPERQWIRGRGSHWRLH